MGLKKTSISDIAKHLKVAKSTVSFIINGKAKEHRISSDLEKYVLDYVNKIGYRPHHLAQSLATGRSNSIGLIVENIADSFFGTIAVEIEQKARDSGYRIVYSSTLGDTKVANSAIDFFRQTQVDGYIIAPPAGVEEQVESLIGEGIPVVIFDRKLNGIDADYVGTNNMEITKTACEHFVEQGFKNIAFITLESEQSQMAERLSGYQKTMRIKNLQEWVFKVPYLENRDGYHQLIKKYLHENEGVDAVFFATNYLCVNGLQAIRELGKSIPEDLGVIVFDENDLFRLYTPGITSIEQPLDELSATIIDTLLKKISQKSPNTTPVTTVKASKLIIRDSSKKKA